MRARVHSHLTTLLLLSSLTYRTVSHRCTSVALVELLDTSDIVKALKDGDWILQGAEIVKVVRRNDFDAAIEFVNQVASTANRIGHHPDIDIRWNTVTLRLSTHSLGGVTDADLALAAALDDIR